VTKFHAKKVDPYNGNEELNRGKFLTYEKRHTLYVFM
jgi:hypothetical protein